MNPAIGLGLFGGAVILVVGLLWGGPAKSHDVYRSLVNPRTGAGCCHDADCRPGMVWRDEQGRLRARIGNLNVSVPESALLPEKMNPHPPTGMICEHSGNFYCVNLSGAGI